MFGLALHFWREIHCGCSLGRWSFCYGLVQITPPLAQPVCFSFQAALVLEIAWTRSLHSCVSSLPARLRQPLPPFCIDAARAFNKCLVRRFISVVRPER